MFGALQQGSDSNMDGGAQRIGVRNEIRPELQVPDLIPASAMGKYSARAWRVEPWKEKLQVGGLSLAGTPSPAKHVGGEQGKKKNCCQRVGAIGGSRCGGTDAESEEVQPRCGSVWEGVGEGAVGPGQATT